MPDPNDTTLEIGETDVETTAPDIGNDLSEQLLSNTLSGAADLMLETKANIQNANSIVRLSAARKFNEVDPLEAAAQAKIMGK